MVRSLQLALGLHKHCPGRTGLSTGRLLQCFPGAGRPCEAALHSSAPDLCLNQGFQRLDASAHAHVELEKGNKIPGCGEVMRVNEPPGAGQ